MNYLGLSTLRVRGYKRFEPYKLYYFENKFLVTNGKMLLYRRAKDREWHLVTSDEMKKWGNKAVRDTREFDHTV